VRRVLGIAVSILAVLVVAPAAFAGGWATVGLSSTPAGTQPGEPWKVNMTVLQHGETPLPGLQPTITIRNGDATKTFAAKPTKETGVYAASVTFPTAGKWTYVVNDGFMSGKAHTFPAVDIGAPAAATGPAATTDDGSGGVSWMWLALGGLAFLLAALILVVRNRRDHGHQPQAA